MARIAGIDLPKNKRGVVGLTYIHGIGPNLAQEILDRVGVDVNKKVQDWSDEEQTNIRALISDEYKVEGALRSETQMNIKRLMDIGSYRGIRHLSVCRLQGNQQKIMPEHVKAAKRPLLIKRKHRKVKIEIPTFYW
jgi:small subunit ribosomal protein S13